MAFRKNKLVFSILDTSKYFFYTLMKLQLLLILVLNIKNNYWWKSWENNKMAAHGNTKEYILYNKISNSYYW